MNRFGWLQPATPAEASRAANSTVAQAMASEGAPAPDSTAVFKAGGIDLLDLVKQDLLRPATVVNLRGLRDLDGIAFGRDGLQVGALATLAQLAAHAQVRQRYPALAQAAEAVASPELRNVGTVGGNLLQRPQCWYFRSSAFHCTRKGGTQCFAYGGDNRYHAVFDNHGGCAIVHPSTLATALVAYGAAVEVSDAQGARRRLLLESFFVAPAQSTQRENVLQPGELVTAVHVPAPAAGTHAAYLRQGERAAFDWPLAEVTAVLELSGGRCRRAAIVLGAASPLPHRARAAEDLLAGHAPDDALLKAAARAAVAGATPLSGNAYKLAILETLVERALRAASQTRERA